MPEQPAETRKPTTTSTTVMVARDGRVTMNVGSEGTRGSGRSTPRCGTFCSAPPPVNGGFFLEGSGSRDERPLRVCDKIPPS